MELKTVWRRCLVLIVLPLAAYWLVGLNTGYWSVVAEPSLWLGGILPSWLQTRLLDPLMGFGLAAMVSFCYYNMTGRYAGRSHARTYCLSKAGDGLLSACLRRRYASNIDCLCYGRSLLGDAGGGYRRWSRACDSHDKG